jgi:hypothetical protein
MNRDILGRFTSNYFKELAKLPFRLMWRAFLALKWQRKVCLLGMVSLAMIPAFDAVATNWPQQTLIYTATRAEAMVMEVPESVGLAELEERLDEIVWGGESQKLVMDEGDIFPVFDPSPSMYARCAKIGGKQHKDCISYGPRQEKIGTIQYYWPMLYGETLTDKEARDVAEGNESSRRFFLDCAVQIKGCANNWTTFRPHAVEGQIYIDLIREIKGL